MNATEARYNAKAEATDREFVSMTRQLMADWTQLDDAMGEIKAVLQAGGCSCSDLGRARTQECPRCKALAIAERAVNYPAAQKLAGQWRV